MTVSCPQDREDPFRCPTKWEYFAAAMALLPRGRAWQSHEAPQRVRHDGAGYGAADYGHARYGQVAVETAHTVLQRYWLSYAAVLEYFAQRACDLVAEFFCFSARETLEFWGADYGFPDPCDPWETLCEKVAAQGGATCEYITWAAARRGWAIGCSDCVTGGAMAGCIEVGCDTLCAPECQPNTLYITVRLADSPAYTAEYVQPLAGRMTAGCSLLCEPNIEHVECLIERIKPAHVQAVYEIA